MPLKDAILDGLSHAVNISVFLESSLVGILLPFHNLHPGFISLSIKEKLGFLLPLIRVHFLELCISGVT